MPSPELRLLVIDPLSESALDAIRRIAAVDYFPGRPEAAVLERLADCNVLVLRSGYHMSEAWLDRAPRLQGVIRAGTGTDNIPLGSLQRRQIRFANIAGANAVSVAEFGIGAMLMLLRHMFPARDSLLAGRWAKAEYCGEELAGKTVGLVGYGRIGSALAHRLTGFNVRLLYCRRHPHGVDGATGAEPAGFVELCQRSDIVSIQVPLTPQTRHMFDEALFAALPRPIYLLNLARYEVIDMAALRTALVAGRITAAFVDPVEPEGFDIAAFAGLPVHFTPHLAGSTVAAQARIGALICEQLAAWRIGQDLRVP